ncbi:MAG TPA: urease subunit gamma [Pirellulales bacterium]
MNLTPRELDKLSVFVVAELARKRKSRGLKLNHPEAVALISEAILEAARDGRTVDECAELAKAVLTRDDVMEGVPALIPLLQIEAMFPGGTSLVSCHNPIP